MVWVLIAVFVLVVIGTILWLPLELEIDSEQNTYRVSWWRILIFSIAPDDKGWHLSFTFFNKKIQLAGARKKTAKPEKAPTKKSSPFPARLIWQMLKNLPRAFSVKRFFVNWDTGDYIRNAHLFPLFHLWSSYSRMQLGINFMGQQEIAIHVQTRLSRLIQAFLRAYFSYKFK